MPKELPAVRRNVNLKLMMKKIYSVFLLLASSVILLSIFNDKTNSQVLSKCCFSSDEIENILTSRKQTESKLISELFFDDTPLFYDTDTNSWFLTVSSSTNKDPIVHFTLINTPVQIVFPDDLQLIPGEIVPFYIYDASVYTSCSLIVTALPLINIESHTTDIPKEAIPMELTLYDPNSRRLITSEGTIHTRGNGSLYFPKHSFRVSLFGKEKNGKEKDFSLLELREDDDWILYAPYTDPEKTRHVFSTNLWHDSCARKNSFGISNGLEFRWVELFLNNRYWGLYTLGYPIDVKQQQITISQSGNFDEFLYKQRYRGPIFNESGMIDNLILQFPGNDEDELLGLNLRRAFFTQLQSPETVDLYINDYQNALDSWLFMKLVQGADNVEYTGIKQIPLNTPNTMRNMLYTIKLSDAGYRFLYTPWDMDKTWGIQFNKEKPLQTADPTDNGFEMSVNPVSVLLKNGDLKIARSIQKEYKDLRENEWSDETIDQMINSFEKDIFDSGAFEREQTRWPLANYSDPQRKLDDFRQYVHQRFASMDEYIASL